MQYRITFESSSTENQANQQLVDFASRLNPHIHFNASGTSYEPSSLYLTILGSIDWLAHRPTYEVITVDLPNRYGLQVSIRIISDHPRKFGAIAQSFAAIMYHLGNHAHSTNVYKTGTGTIGLRQPDPWATFSIQVEDSGTPQPYQISSSSLSSVSTNPIATSRQAKRQNKRRQQLNTSPKIIPRSQQEESTTSPPQTITPYPLDPGLNPQVYILPHNTTSYIPASTLTILRLMSFNFIITTMIYIWSYPPQPDQGSCIKSSAPSTNLVISACVPDYHHPTVTSKTRSTGYGCLRGE